MRELRNSFVSWVVGIIGLFVFTHNSNVALDTKFRDLNYLAWEAVTRETDQFKQVKDRDIIISTTSNDAYEFNAGRFFYNTGKRLAYIFRIDILWPELNTCQESLDGVCSSTYLEGSIDRAKKTIPNLNRDKNNWPRVTLDGDWVDQMQEVNALDNSEVWVLDLFLMTPNTAVSYFSRTTDRNGFPTVKLNSSQVFTVSKSKDNEFNLKVFDECLVPRNQQATRSSNGLWIREWEFPKNTDFTVDYRSVFFGSC